MSPTFSPISLGGIGKATVTGTTGSPTTNNNARAGKTIYAFNGSGSITVGTAGTVEALLIGGGGFGATAGGGAGGFVSHPSIIIPSGTHTITVGAGGTGRYHGSSGGASSIGISPSTSGFFAFGGGGGGSNAQAMKPQHRRHRMGSRTRSSRPRT